MSKHCIICNSILTGFQKKFCSTKCKVKNHSSYPYQKARAKIRKMNAIQKLGGCCSICKYKKNIAALCFHHLSGKDISLDARSMSNRSQDILDKELSKCILLCHNCHMELHHPQWNDLDLSS